MKTSPQQAAAATSLRPIGVIVVAALIAGCSASSSRRSPGTRSAMAGGGGRSSGMVGASGGQSDIEEDIRRKEARRRARMEERLRDRRNTISRSSASTRADADDMPAFPWPPPRASAFMTIPENLLPRAGSSRLAEVEGSLRAALFAGGYAEISDFTAPEGFALVTRVERIRDSGAPALEDRWAQPSGGVTSRTLFDHLGGLLFVKPGFFRILVFVVTTQAFTQADTPVSQARAESWVREGAAALPPQVADAAYTRRHRTLVLVYEFVQADQDKPAILRSPGRLSAIEHLRTNGVLQNIHAAWPPPF